jgi:hypothetical protein
VEAAIVNDEPVEFEVAVSREDADVLVDLEDWIRRERIETLQVSRKPGSALPGEMGAADVVLQVLLNAPLIGALSASFQSFLTSRRRDFELEIRGSDGSVRKLRASGASAEDIAEALAALRDG